MSKDQDIKVKLSVNIISPKESSAKEADFIQAPGKEGILGIAPDHTKIVTLLRKGEVIIKENNRADEKIPLNDGIIQVSNNNVDIFIND